MIKTINVADLYTAVLSVVVRHGDPGMVVGTIELDRRSCALKPPRVYARHAQTKEGLRVPSGAVEIFLGNAAWQFSPFPIEHLQAQSVRQEDSPEDLYKRIPARSILTVVFEIAQPHSEDIEIFFAFDGYFLEGDDG